MCAFVLSVLTAEYFRLSLTETIIAVPIIAPSTLLIINMRVVPQGKILCERLIIGIKSIP